MLKGLWLDKLNKSVCVQTSRFLISAMLQYLYCKFTTICLHFFLLWCFDASWVPGGLNACLSFTAAGPAASKCSFLCSSCCRFPFFNVHLSSDQVPCLLNPPTDVLSSEAAKPHTARAIPCVLNVIQTAITCKGKHDAGTTPVSQTPHPHTPPSPFVFECNPLATCVLWGHINKINYLYDLKTFMWFIRF